MYWPLRLLKIKDKYSLAALMKLLWYWYVIRGAGSILKTGDERSHVESGYGHVRGGSDALVLLSSHHPSPASLHSWKSGYHFCCCWL